MTRDSNRQHPVSPPFYQNMGQAFHLRTEISGRARGAYDVSMISLSTTA